MVVRHTSEETRSGCLSSEQKRLPEGTNVRSLTSAPVTFDPSHAW
jgi:hypothetical protein